jgi:hypothetical protein
VTINGSNYTTVTNCTVYDCAGDCVYVHNTTCYGWSITDNTLYTTLGAGAENGIDAKMNTSTARATISGNTVYGFYACTGLIGGSGDGDGEGISMHNDCNYTDCYDNVIYDCTSGITIEDGATSVVVRNNLIYDLHTTVQDPNATSSNMGAIHVVQGNGVDIWNNTVHNAPVNSLIFITSLTDVVIQNNIFNDCGSIHNEGMSGKTVDHNCWYNCTETISGTGDVTSDPLFTNEGADDYTLSASSPCIDAGTDVGLPYNGSAPDMGSFETSIQVSDSVTVTESSTVTIAGVPPGISVNASDTTSVSESASVLNLGEFPIRFETGDLSEWDSTVTSGGGTIGVSGAAANEGSYGQYSTISSGATSYGKKEYDNKSEIRCGFWFNPNSVTMGDGESFGIATGTGNSDYRIGLERSGSDYEIYVGVENDSSTFEYCPTNATLRSYGTSGWHWVEYHVKRSTGPGDDNGFGKVWIDVVDASADAEITGVNDDTKDHDDIQMGAIAGVDAGTSGTIYFDYVMGNDDGTAIGPPFLPVSASDSVSTSESVGMNVVAGDTRQVNVSDSAGVSESYSITGPPGADLSINVSDSVGVSESHLVNLRPPAVVMHIDGTHLDVAGVAVMVGT